MPLIGGTGQPIIRVSDKFVAFLAPPSARPPTRSKAAALYVFWETKLKRELFFVQKKATRKLRPALQAYFVTRNSTLVLRQTVTWLAGFRYVCVCVCVCYSTGWLHDWMMLMVIFKFVL